MPRQGSVVFADFETVQGQSAIMNITRSDGKKYSIAADIYDDQGNVIGNVGQGGQAFVRGIEQQGNINIKWLEESKTCKLSCALSTKFRSRKNSAIYYSEWNSVSDSVTTRDVK